MSMRKLIISLILVAACLTVGIAILKLELSAPPAAALVHRKIVRGAVALTIKNAKGGMALFRSGDSGDCSEHFDCADPWFLDGFQGIPVAAEKVQNTLEALATARVIQTVPGSGDLELYGLAPPELEVSVQGKDDRLRRLLIGKRSEYLGGRYALSVDGRTVLLVEDTLLPLTTVAQHEYFALAPQAFVPEEVDGFSVISPGEEYRVYKKNELWVVENTKTGLRVPANAYNVESFLFAVAGLSAGRLVPLSTDEGKTLSEKLSIQVALLQKDSEMSQVILFALSNLLRLPGIALPPDQVLYRPDRSQAIYFAPQGVVAMLFQGSAAFRKSRILEFDVRDFDRAILYSRAEGVFEISRDESLWTVNEKPGDGPFVKDLFREISEIECSGFVSGEIRGGTDEMTARIWLRGRKEPLEAAFVSPGKGAENFFVRAADEIHGCFVDARRFKRILPRGEILYQAEGKK
jgi:hypothetical protein